jgi:hypothetical protein
MTCFTLYFVQPCRSGLLKWIQDCLLSHFVQVINCMLYSGLANRQGEQISTLVDQAGSHNRANLYHRTSPLLLVREWTSRDGMTRGFVVKYSPARSVVSCRWEKAKFTCNDQGTAGNWLLTCDGYGTELCVMEWEGAPDTIVSSSGIGTGYLGQKLVIFLIWLLFLVSA